MLKPRKVKAVDRSRHDNDIHGKIIRWLEVIRKVLEHPDVVRKNVYNMDETGVMLCMRGSAKVLLGQDDLRNYRGAGVMCTMITAVECISCHGLYLSPLIISPANNHRSNWTTYLTPGRYYACSKLGYLDSKISSDFELNV